MASTPVTPTRSNTISYTPTTMGVAVAYTPTTMGVAVAYSPSMTAATLTIDEKEADCKTKFAAINAAATALGADATALSATITPLNANIAKIDTNTTAIDASLAPLEANVAKIDTNTTNIQTAINSVAAERIVYSATGIKADTALTDALPIGYIVDTIVFKTTTNNGDVTAKVGTSDGGEEIMAAANIQGGTAGDIALVKEVGGGTPYLVLVDHLPATAARTIYITSAAWDATTEYTVYVSLKKVMY